MPAQARQLRADRVQRLDEVLAVGPGHAGVQVRIARREPAHVSKAPGGEARRFWPVPAARQREHVADGKKKGGMADARDQPVVRHRVHHHRVRSHRLHELGDPRLVASEHPGRALEH